MKKTKVIQVNNIDEIGSSFNGFRLSEFIKNNQDFESSQLVLYKLSDKDVSYKILSDYDIKLFEKLSYFEDDILSIHSNISLSSPALLNNDKYLESDIVHFHQFHNSRLSLYSLIEISKNKKIVISLHDPWFLSGRCVHSYECKKWKTGCEECAYLDTLFPMKIDNTKSLWNLKKKIFNLIDCDLIVSSKYMENLAKNSPYLKNKRIHLIPLGLNINKFSPIKDNKKLRNKLGIPENDFVFFLRSQDEFKGTRYVREAISNIKEHITIITCDQKGLLDNLNNKIKIIEYGVVNEEMMIDLFRACDVFLMPSISESFGMMAVEAMACGKPVIIFNNTSLPSVTFAPECGILVKNLNSEDLKEKMIWIKNNSDELKRRGDFGRKIVIENYDINLSFNKTVDLYKEICSRKNIKINIDNKLEKNNNSNIDILAIKLFDIGKELGLKKELSYLKPLLSSNNYSDKLIDYSDFEVQEVIKKFNDIVYKYRKKSYKIGRINTAKKLLKTDKKEFIKKVVESLR